MMLVDCVYIRKKHIELYFSLIQSVFSDGAGGAFPALWSGKPFSVATCPPQSSFTWCPSSCRDRHHWPYSKSSDRLAEWRAQTRTSGQSGEHNSVTVEDGLVCFYPHLAWMSGGLKFALCSSEDAVTVQRQNKQIPKFLSEKDLILILVNFA